MREVTHLKNLKALATLNLSNNPIEVSQEGQGGRGHVGYICSGNIEIKFHRI